MVLEINSKNLHMKRVKKINQIFLLPCIPPPPTLSPHPPTPPPALLFHSKHSKLGFFSLFYSNIMAIIYYFAYLRKAAWPQVNWSEAEDNAMCEIVISSIF